jgi:hypothetical protein
MGEWGTGEASVSKFKVGDRVRITGGSSGNKSNLYGMLATVAGPLEVRSGVSGWRGHCHVIDVDGIGSVWRGHPISRRPCDMEPIDDRPELTTWEAVHASCGWMPGMGVAL